MWLVYFLVGVILYMDVLMFMIIVMPMIMSVVMFMIVIVVMILHMYDELGRHNTTFVDLFGVEIESIDAQRQQGGSQCLKISARVE